MSPPIFTPDGNEVSEIVLPDGSTASEVIGPDGNVVFEGGPDIPDAVVAQYLFEDDSDPSVAIDDVGSNNADITGATYDADAQSGAFALSHDGTGDYLQSQPTVDLVSSGETNAIGLGCFVKPQLANRYPYPVAYGPTGGDLFGIWFNVDGDDSLNARLQVGGSNVDVTTSASYDSYQHVYANATDSDINIIVDGTVADSATHSIDISNLGAGSLWTGIRPDQVGNDDFSLDGLVDNATYSDGQLTETDVQTLINQ
jgi:hypothetical protein